VKSLHCVLSLVSIQRNARIGTASVSLFWPLHRLHPLFLHLFRTFLASVLFVAYFLGSLMETWLHVVLRSVHHNVVNSCILLLTSQNQNSSAFLERIYNFSSALEKC